MFVDRFPHNKESQRHYHPPVQQGRLIELALVSLVNLRKLSGGHFPFGTWLRRLAVISQAQVTSRSKQYLRWCSIASSNPARLASARAVVSREINCSRSVDCRR